MTDVRDAMKPYIAAAASIRAPGDDNATGFLVAGSEGRTWFATNGHLAIDPSEPAAGGQAAVPATLVTYPYDGEHYVILERDGVLALARLETYNTYGVTSEKGQGNGVNKERTSHDVAIYELLSPTQSRTIAAGLRVSGDQAVGGAFTARLQGVAQEISSGTKDFSMEMFGAFPAVPLALDIPEEPLTVQAGMAANQALGQEGVSVTVGYIPRYNGDAAQPLNEAIAVPGRFVRTGQRLTGDLTDHELVITPDPALLDTGIREEPISFNNFSGSMVLALVDGEDGPDLVLAGMHRARNRTEGTMDAVPLPVLLEALRVAEQDSARSLAQGEAVAIADRSEFVAPNTGLPMASAAVSSMVRN